MDLYHAACAVQGTSRKERVVFCEALIWRAHVADKYVKRVHKLHPEWGDGSLRSAATLHQVGPPIQIGPSDFLECFSIVLNALLENRLIRSHPN